MLVVGGSQLATATTSSEMTVKSGAFSCTFDDQVLSACSGLVGDINPFTGVLTVTGSINGWAVSISSGTSLSPNTQTPTFGLDLGVNSATCTGLGCTTDNLEVIFSDVDFALPPSVDPNGFRHHFSANITGDGTTTSSAYVDDNNGIFTEANLISTIGPFKAPGGADTTSGPATGTTTALYSLTLHDIFTSGGTGTSFSTDDSITSGVPEPLGVALFGTVLALCASRLRRHPKA